MLIIKDKLFVQKLKSILKYIAKDKHSAAISFEYHLSQKFSLLKSSPNIYKQSKCFQDTNYRDLIHQGYTIIYKIEEKRILILEIFKWQDR